MSDLITVGCFGRPFGVRGWIKVNSFTTPVGGILGFGELMINKDGSWFCIRFEKSKINLNDIVVKLPSYDSPEQVRCFTNVKIAVWRRQLPNLDHGEYYWCDLIGLNVISSEGVCFGVVQNLIATGSNDVLVVVGETKQLIPYTSQVILEVDLSKKIIVVDWDGCFM